MYINRNKADVTLGRSAEFEAMVEEWSTIQAQNAGFVGATVLQSFAHPGLYTLLSRWTDRDAAIAAGRREQFTAFARRFIVSGLVRPTRLTEAYESVFEVDQTNTSASASTAERWIDFSLATPMVAPAFESMMRQFADLTKQHAPGVLSVRLRRSAGRDTKYLLLLITTDRAAARDWLLTPEVRSFTETQTMTEILAASPSAEIHQVVKRYVGPAPEALEPAQAAATRST